MKYDLGSRNIHCFLEQHHIKNERGLPIEFKQHPFLWDVYGDMSPNQAVLKAPQIGMTTLEIIKSLWVAKYLRKDIIYTLPTAADVLDMAGGKVNRIIAQNPIFNSWVKDHDTVEQKKVGDNLIYYRGTWTQKQAMMVSSGLNIHDEVDASKQEVITQYETRLQAEKDGWRWYFSHPSLTNIGVDTYWQQSDQKHWFIQCPHCSARQYLKWPESIDPIRKCYQCRKCYKELSDDDRRKGEWVVKYKDRPFSGYWISQLICPWISAEKILTDHKDPTKDEQYFHNYVLGLAYSSKSATVLAKDIEQNLTSEVNDQEAPVIIGVDTGLPIWYVLGNSKGLFYYGNCNGYDTLRGLLKRYTRSVLIADQGGDLIGIRALQDEFRGRVFLCHYRQDRKTMEIVKWGDGDEYGNVVVDRNRMMQLMIDELKDNRLPISGTREDWNEYIGHYMNLYRTEEPDNLGVTRYKWERRGPDHLVHATLYWRVGMDKFGMSGDGGIVEPANSRGLGTPYLDDSNRLVGALNLNVGDEG